MTSELILLLFSLLTSCVASLTWSWIQSFSSTPGVCGVPLLYLHVLQIIVEMWIKVSNAPKQGFELIVGNKKFVNLKLEGLIYLTPFVIQYSSDWLIVIKVNQFHSDMLCNMHVSWSNPQSVFIWLLSQVPFRQCGSQACNKSACSTIHAVKNNENADWISQSTWSMKYIMINESLTDLFILGHSQLVPQRLQLYLSS